MTKGWIRIFTVSLRLLALVATLAAAIIMVTSHDSAEVLNLTFKAKYINESAFNLITLFVSSKSLLWRLVVILDGVITILLTSSVSAALTIAHVGKKGNSHAGWMPICGQVPKFCNQVTGSLIAGFIAAIVVYLVLILYSLRTVLSPLFTL